MSSGATVESLTKTFVETASETVNEYRFVKPSGAGVMHAGVGDGQAVIGATGIDATVIDGEKWAVKLRNSGGSVLIFMAAAVSKFARVYAAADGKGTDIAIGKPVGIALEAATAAGDIIEVLWTESDASSDPFAVLPLNAAATTAALAVAAGLYVGMVAEDNYGNRYRLVLSDNVNGTAAGVGTPMGIRTAGVSEFDISDDLAASTEFQVRGLSASIFTSTNVVGWMLIEGSLENALNGVGMTVTTDGSVAQGNALYWGADSVVHGIVPTATMTDHTFFGSAAKADAGTVLSAAQVNFTALNSHGVA